jgi:hypothetical protein
MSTITIGSVTAPVRHLSIRESTDAVPTMRIQIVVPYNQIAGYLLSRPNVSVTVEIDDVTSTFVGRLTSIRAGPHGDTEVEVVSRWLGHLSLYMPSVAKEYAGCESYEGYWNKCYWTVHGVIRDVANTAGVPVYLLFPDCQLGSNARWEGTSALSFIVSILNGAGYRSTGRHRVDILERPEGVYFVLRSSFHSSVPVPAERVIEWSIEASIPESHFAMRTGDGSGGGSARDPCIEGGSAYKLEPRDQTPEDDPCRAGTDNPPGGNRPKPSTPPTPPTSPTVIDLTDPCINGDRTVAIVERRSTDKEEIETITSFDYRTVRAATFTRGECVVASEVRISRASYKDPKSKILRRDEYTEVTYEHEGILLTDATGAISGERVVQTYRSERTWVHVERKSEPGQTSSPCEVMDFLSRERTETTRWAQADGEAFPYIIITSESSLTDDEYCEALRKGTASKLPLRSTEIRYNIKSGSFMNHVTRTWKYDADGNLIDSSEVTEHSMGEWRSNRELIRYMNISIDNLRDWIQTIQPTMPTSLPLTPFNTSANPSSASSAIDGSSKPTKQQRWIRECGPPPPPDGFKWERDTSKVGQCDPDGGTPGVTYSFPMAGDTDQLDRILNWIRDEGTSRLLETLSCTLVALPGITVGSRLEFSGIPELENKSWYVIQLNTDIGVDGATQRVVALTWV